MSTSLTDRDGFPRSDIDVAQGTPLCAACRPISAAALCPSGLLISDTQVPP